MARNWQESETNYLKRYGSTKTPEELAQRFDTDPKEVMRRLRELGLAPKEGSSQSEGDPILEEFSKALEAVHKKNWKKAASLLEKVASDADQMEVAGRARQYLEVCRARIREVLSEDGEEPYLRAVYHKNRGDLDKAMEIVRQGSTNDDRFAYLEASLHALANRFDEAEKALRRAVELNSKNRVYAFHDPDFAVLRKSEEHAHLFGLP